MFTDRAHDSAQPSSKCFSPQLPRQAQTPTPPPNSFHSLLPSLGPPRSLGCPTRAAAGTPARAHGAPGAAQGLTARRAGHGRHNATQWGTCLGAGPPGWGGAAAGGPWGQGRGRAAAGAPASQLGSRAPHGCCAAAAGGTWRRGGSGAAASAAWAGCPCCSSPSWWPGPTTRTWWSCACVSTGRATGGPGRRPRQSTALKQRLGLGRGERASFAEVFGRLCVCNVYDKESGPPGGGGGVVGARRAS